MDNSAMLWQLMQSLSGGTSEEQAHIQEQTGFEHTLLSLRPLMPPKQQRIIDLMIKMQEVKALMHEIQGLH
ncbi:MAG: hypothetical protein FWE11_10295 [Defluviitaleaceae bacterium]|nr:hypothetical protein [Defluviitaleaceae bacterium]